MDPNVSPNSAFFYPNAAEAALKLQFVGRKIRDVTPPAVILDAAVVRRNCNLMLDTAERLGVGFRAHVKTHKEGMLIPRLQTLQLSKLQVGENSKTIRLIASTVAEIENLLPWLLECSRGGKDVNIIYGIPVSPSAIQRLATVARALGENCVGLFVDHPAHISEIDALDELSWPGRIPVFVNIDVGYHREGVAAQSQQLAEIASSLAASKRARLAGLYTHLGSSYSVNNPQEALLALSEELVGLEAGALAFLERSGAQETGNSKIVLSLGATPTATAAQNLFEDSEGAKQYRTTLDRINQSFAVELHAGVYPVMDMQQLATRARPAQSQTNPGQSLLSFADLGMRTLVEVASVYTDRGEKPEALIAAGSIVLGREPCKSYPGWGVVSPWPLQSNAHYDPEESKTGWIVGRISQEHGILTWEGPTNGMRQLSLGEKLLLWPNHACMAGVGFGWYLIVDSDQSDGETIVDVWQRWRGW